MITEPFAEPVCVALVDEGFNDAQIHHYLGSALPLRVVSWQRQDYLGIITTLRPQVIVVWGEPEELIHDRCRLVASIFSPFEPTVMSATVGDGAEETPHLAVQQLGVGATVHIMGLSDIHLP